MWGSISIQVVAKQLAFRAEQKVRYVQQNVFGIVVDVHFLWQFGAGNCEDTWDSVTSQAVSQLRDVPYFFNVLGSHAIESMSRCRILEIVRDNDTKTWIISFDLDVKDKPQLHPRPNKRSTQGHFRFRRYSAGRGQVAPVGWHWSWVREGMASVCWSITWVLGPIPISLTLHVSRFHLAFASMGHWL